MSRWLQGILKHFMALGFFFFLLQNCGFPLLFLGWMFFNVQLESGYNLSLLNERVFHGLTGAMKSQAQVQHSDPRGLSRRQRSGSTQEVTVVNRLSVCR